jgi:hypothetical protein
MGWPLWISDAKPSWFARHKILTGIAGGFVGLTLLIAVTGGPGDSSKDDFQAGMAAGQAAADKAAADKAAADKAAADKAAADKAAASSSGSAKIVVPDGVGMDYQSAQDLWRSAGLIVAPATDATGANRIPFLDSNWVVLDQDLKAGTTVDPNTAITATIKKFTDG